MNNSEEQLGEGLLPADGHIRPWRPDWTAVFVLEVARQLDKFVCTIAFWVFVSTHTWKHFKCVNEVWAGHMLLKFRSISNVSMKFANISTSFPDWSTCTSVWETSTYFGKPSSMHLTSFWIISFRLKTRCEVIWTVNQ